jgi:hypothetical protein
MHGNGARGGQAVAMFADAGFSCDPGHQPRLSATNRFPTKHAPCCKLGMPPGRPLYGPIETIGRMHDEGWSARTWCTLHCSREIDIDLAALIEKVGRDYSLINRRCRCRTPGCPGWMRFFYLHGVYRRMWTDACADRWDEADRRSK